MQTWLVHTRQPRRLCRELGPRGMLGFILIGTGMIVSSLVYPIYLATLAAMASNPLGLWGDGGLVPAIVLGINFFNLIAGYVAMAFLAGRALNLRGRTVGVRGFVFLPIYWLLMSLAGYRAILQLAFRPHHWEKTPHSRRSRPDQAP